MNLLLMKKIYGTGTLAINNIPKSSMLLDKREMGKKDRGFATQKVRQDKNVCIVQWNDNKPVNSISSITPKNPITSSRRWSKKDRQFIDVQCPNIVKKYNAEMEGVDLIDRFLVLYRMDSKTYKWTYRAIMHFLDLGACNAWLLYRQNNTNLSRRDLKCLLEFKLTLADQLIAEDSESSDDSSTDEEEVGTSACTRQETSSQTPTI
ncbi:uncharacterized protein LOC113467722 [Diaphorina citri]|uniref:Uncharacterized protein LOC113467722 n=1 Tax=Diaphorina citri TaxID=121845 RepID=A0A3Q0IZJ5_DIACI|nr:uncharacterized protein LOC113467722 [Diaphorina citri]